jgi:SAM-dependent methyltransferase
MNVKEIIKEFRSLSEWREWAAKSDSEVSSPTTNEGILGDILRNGITEPITNRKYNREDVVINGRNYRETVKAGGLISRQRAILSSQDYYEKISSRNYRTRKTKVYAPEALTEFALYLRSIYPKFLGSEYAETEEEKQQLWPIISQDLTKLSFPDSSFDLVITGDVLEHVPDIDQSFREIYRVLGTGGLTISTFPFAYGGDSGAHRAKIVGNKIVHLLSPEFHGNPMRAEEGSLVFEIPGWNIVQRVKGVGFEDAFFLYIRSATYGIFSQDINGVFVFVAVKA